MTITRDLLQAFVPFDSLDDECLDKALAKVSVREFSRGDVVLKQDFRTDESFFLLKGKVELRETGKITQYVAADTDASKVVLNPGNTSKFGIVSVGRVQMMSIEREFLDLLLTWSQSGYSSFNSLQDNHIDVNVEEECDWMSSLLQSPLFQKIPPANIQQLFAHFESIELVAGQVIMREGDIGDFFYVIESGHADVSSKGSNSVAELAPGQYFGEEALVGDTLRNATVTMSTAGTLMRLDKSVFIELLQEPVLRYIALDQVDDTVPSQIVDVRLPIEHRHNAVPGSMNIPLGRLRKQFENLSQGHRLVVTDDGGRRSKVAAHLLCQAGFDSYILEDAERHYA